MSELSFPTGHVVPANLFSLFASFGRAPVRKCRTQNLFSPGTTHGSYDLVDADSPATHKQGI